MSSSVSQTSVKRSLSSPPRGLHISTAAAKQGWIIVAALGDQLDTTLLKLSISPTDRYMTTAIQQGRRHCPMRGIYICFTPSRSRFLSPKWPPHVQCSSKARAVAASGYMHQLKTIWAKLELPLVVAVCPLQQSTAVVLPPEGRVDQLITTLVKLLLLSALCACN